MLAATSSRLHASPGRNIRSVDQDTPARTARASNIMVRTTRKSLRIRTASPRVRSTAAAYRNAEDTRKERGPRSERYGCGAHRVRRARRSRPNNRRPHRSAARRAADAAVRDDVEDGGRTTRGARWAPPARGAVQGVSAGTARLSAGHRADTRGAPPVGPKSRSTLSILHARSAGNPPRMQKAFTATAAARSTVHGDGANVRLPLARWPPLGRR